MAMIPRHCAHRGWSPRAPVGRAVVIAGVLIAALIIAAASHAGPTGGQVVAGSGTIQRPDVNTTLVRQQSPSLAVDWTGFDVAGHELVQFQQPSSSSAVLNRVFNQLPSQIHGSIVANGLVLIMNPNGVVFGPGARVEVGGLMASSLDIRVEDFMSGSYLFSAAPGVEPGAIVNRGLIKAATGGGVTLLGGSVRNDGVIIADLGHVLMGAGREALVDFDGDGLIRFHVDGALLRDIASEDSAVRNSGEIQADGGQVLLSAAVARDIVDRAINNEGIIRAASIERASGVVRLSATGGNVENSGTIDVSVVEPGDAGAVSLESDVGVAQLGHIHADAAAGDGGSVELRSAGLTVLEAASGLSARASAGGGEVRVLGENVAMQDAAIIDVSGGLGGGTVLIGGDYQGGNPSVPNATRTGIAEGARILADATENGDGGRVIVWSDTMTSFYGFISARGGPSGGDGGLAEVSGKDYLAFRGRADLTANRGTRGTLLLDPGSLVIVGGSGNGDPDGSAERFSGLGADSAAGEILFSDLGPSIVYQSEIEGQSAFADITLQAAHSISTSGTFDDATLVLAPNSNLLIETRNRGSGEAGLINLTSSAHGTGLTIATQGTGTLTVRSGAGGDQSTPILLPNLISASDIHVVAGGGPFSSVLVFGTLAGANVDIDASGSVTVVGGARVVAGGDGTSLSIDATGITLLDGAPVAATVANSGTGTVSLTSTGAANILLGDNAIANGVGMLSLGSGRSILAINLTDVTDTVNEIVGAGSVSLQASEEIGSDTAHIEMAGVTDLMIDVDDGDFFLSGSDGAGGPGSALSRLTLNLEPQDDGKYVIDNFIDQAFDFAQGAFGDDLIVREITSASLLDLSITTVDAGIVIGGEGGTGIALAGAGNVALESSGYIAEALNDDSALVVAEITTDGRINLVANSDIGASGMLDLASGSSGLTVLEARSGSGAVRISAGGALRIDGSGIEAADGGNLAAAGALTIAADVETNADMVFTAGNDTALAGNDLSIAAGALVKLDSERAAGLYFNAGDNIAFAGGSVQTRGIGNHRVELHADTENGGSDGVIGGISQTGVDTSVSSDHLGVVSGGGTDLRTSVASLSADNTTAGAQHILNEGDVVLVGIVRNQARGAALTLVTEDGSIDTDSAIVAGNAGLLTLDARRRSPIGAADVTIGAGGVLSAGGDVAVVAADAIHLGGPVDSGAASVILDAGAGIDQPAGHIVSANVISRSGASTVLDRPGNAIGELSATATGDVQVRNDTVLALGASDIRGSLRIDNGLGLRVPGPVSVGGKATLVTAAGDVDGAGGILEAAELEVDAAGGIGIVAAFETDISGNVFLRSRGTASGGDIHFRERGDFATRQLPVLATDAGSSQSVSIAAAGVLTVDDDPVDTPNLGPGDRLELDATRITLAEKISGHDVDVRFKAPVDVTESVFITLDKGLLTFDGNVSPGVNTALTLESEVAFASGRVTGARGSSLIIEDTLNLVTDTTLAVDNLRLSGDPSSVIGRGSLTLLPATHGKDIVIGGRSGLMPDVTVATLQKFGGARALNVGVPAFPATRAPFAGNVRVEAGLSVGSAVLTVGGLGDVSLDNHGMPLASDRGINIVAVGDRRVFPGLVAHAGGNILDTDASPLAAATLKAPVVNVIAQGRVGSSANALEIEVGLGGRAEFVTGADNAFINTLPGGERVINVAGTSRILAAFQTQGFFLDALSRAALARTVGLETTGLETTGLGELLYVDEGVFLLPDPYTTPVQAILLPALMDPDFPADRRPDGPDDEDAWQAFYSGVLRDYVQSRYLLPDNASESDREAADTHSAREWQTLVAHFETVRARERAAIATGTAGS